MQPVEARSSGLGVRVGAPQGSRPERNSPVPGSAAGSTPCPALPCPVLRCAGRAPAAGAVAPGGPGREARPSPGPILGEAV